MPFKQARVIGGCTHNCLEVAKCLVIQQFAPKTIRYRGGLNHTICRLDNGVVGIVIPSVPPVHGSTTDLREIMDKIEHMNSTTRRSLYVRPCNLTFDHPTILRADQYTVMFDHSPIYARTGPRLETIEVSFRVGIGPRLRSVRPSD